MYRFIGDNNVNNYICFGTSNKETCLNNPEKYMYRIIGVKSDGTLKLIKKEAIHKLAGKMKWGINDNNVEQWNVSDLFSKLNGETYLNNSFYIPNETWNNYIVLVDWKYGFTSNQVAWYDVNGNRGRDGDAVYFAEQKWKDSVNAKIGIMYMSDYYYVVENNTNGWINIVNNDDMIDVEKYENAEFFINKKIQKEL